MISVTAHSAAGPRPLRICFDLTGQEHWHRVEWERFLGAIAPGGGTDAQLVDRPSEADCVIATVMSWSFSDGGRVFGRLNTATDGPPRFVWDASDQPAGREPGFYCSLPRTLFDPRRHRTFCYPLRYNECIQPADLADARVLFGFIGGITSGVRARLFQALHRHGRADEMMVLEQSGPWNQMFDRSGVSAKQQYAEALRRSRFFICPRSNGTGSLGLFETMLSSRVPVIISDDYVLPADIDWDGCSVRVRFAFVEVSFEETHTDAQLFQPVHDHMRAHGFHLCGLYDQWNRSSVLDCCNALYFNPAAHPHPSSP